VTSSTRWRDTWPLTWRDLGRLVTAYVVLSGAFILIGLPLRDEDRHGTIGRIDHDVATWMVEHRGSTVNMLTNIGSGFANTIVKVVVTTAIVLVMLRRWHRWFEPAYVAIVLVLEASIFITVTLIVGRPRPAVVRLDTSNVASSFPSGHMAAAVAYAAIAVVTFWHTRRRWPRVLVTTGAVIVPIVVGVSRVQRGLHHLSDVIAGAVLGLACLVVTTRLMVSAQARWEATSGASSSTEAFDSAGSDPPSASSPRAAVVRPASSAD
jgi:membrane-associated phospholipid phosphatase